MSISNVTLSWMMLVTFIDPKLAPQEDYQSIRREAKDAS
jgi:hypothetical protein